MKKILAPALCIALFLMLAIPVMAADHVTLPAAPKANITIDGVRDDGYGDKATA